MLTFRSSGLLFITSLVLLTVLIYFANISLWWLLLPMAIFKLLIIWGSANIQSNFYLKAHNSGSNKEKQIAITFDDGPNESYTPSILSALEQYNAKATFFVIGKNIEENERIIKSIDQQGHCIGGHSFSHSFFIDFKSTKGFIQEIEETNELIQKITNKRPRLFRPPYGVTTPNIASAVKILQQDVIGWNIRSLDTTKDDEKTVFKRVKEQMCPGAIILFHDTSDKTVEVLKQTLNFAKENGFKVVSIEELLNIKAYE